MGIKSVSSKEIGTYMKSVRLKQGLSQIELARHLGISSQFLGKIECEEVPFPIRHLVKATKKLNLNPKKIRTIFARRAARQIETIINKL